MIYPAPEKIFLLCNKAAGRPADFLTKGAVITNVVKTSVKAIFFSSAFYSPVKLSSFKVCQVKILTELKINWNITGITGLCTGERQY